MTARSAQTPELLRLTRRREHPRCIACAPELSHGLRLLFHPAPDGGVAATFDCPASAQGYDGILHGGVIALLLDSAMTHCLFAHAIPALTAELTVRYRESVAIGQPARVSARLLRRAGKAFRLEAELRQADRIRATAQATFIAAPAAQKGTAP